MWLREVSQGGSSFTMGSAMLYYNVGDDEREYIPYLL
jgi:hypothetical protein